ncbi:MAG: molybdopterin dinucleotide binding domain-containing protein, partial [Dehalococcoidia bacterium]|nr:molybdopterin dinucleotide binding domain-containing protein [Dehalococcoidia bacterium]
YDLWSFYYRDALHTNSFTMENPLLDEASHLTPYTYRISINAGMARKKSIKDNDLIWVESSYGRKIKGRANVIEGIMPEALGIAACAGHWAKGMPIAKDKGVFYNDLIEIDYDHMDPSNLNMDLCAKVKIYKA